MFIVLAAAAPRANGQCLDWQFGFGTPGNGLEDDVRAMAVFDDGNGPALYVGGLFQQAGGVPASHLARWNGSQWSDVDGGVDNTVFALAVYDDGTGPALYVGGNFSTAGSLSATGIARWDGSTWSSVGSGVDFGVRALTVGSSPLGSSLFVGGPFTMAGGMPANRIASWDGTSWSALGQGVDDTVHALTLHDDGGGLQLYCGGEFSTAGGLSAHRVARWDGLTWSALPGPFAGGNSLVLTLTPFDDGLGGGSTLYVGGDFTFVNGVQSPNLISWDGAQWNPLSADVLNGPVADLHVHDDGSGTALFACGEFTNAGPQTVNFVAAWDGSTWSSLGLGLFPAAGSERALALSVYDDAFGSGLYVGGNLAMAGSIQSDHIARWGVACAPPIIEGQPSDQLAAFPAQVTFDVLAAGTGPITYQWRREGLPIQDSTYVVGATTETLELFAWNWGDAGTYDCLVSNPFGSILTAPATLTVPAPGTGTPIVASASVLPPDPVGDLPGTTFTSVDPGVQSSIGEVVFSAEIDSIASLNLWEPLSPTSNIVRAGDPVPGVFLSTFDSDFNSFFASANGTASFTARIAGPGITNDTDEGLWHAQGGTLHTIALEGDPTPGVAGAVFRAISAPAVSDSGRLLFRSDAYASGTYVTTGAWSWSPGGSLSLLASVGDPAPGTGGSFTGVGLGLDANETGRVAFGGRLDTTTGINYGGLTDFGIWVDDGVGAFAAVKSGDAAPGVVPGANLEDLGLGTFLVGDDGSVAFSTRVAGPGGYHESALYRWDGSLTPIAVYGQPAPGAAPDSTFLSPTPGAIDSQGALIFKSTLDTNCPPPCAKEGLWLWDENEDLHLIFLDAPEPLPATPPGFVTSQFRTVAMNDGNHAVIEFELTDGGSNYSGLFGWSLADGIYPIAVPGSQIEVKPGVFGTVRDASLGSIDGGSVGFPSKSLSDSGVVTFHVVFTGDSRGLIREDLSKFRFLFFGAPYCTAKTDSQGCAPPMVTTGYPSATIADPFLINATSVRNQKNGLLFYGLNGPADLPFLGGTLCVAPPIRRTAPQSSGGSPPPINNCSGALSFDFGALILSGQDPFLTQGQQVNAQYWYRDPGDAAFGSGLSEAVEFAIGN